MNERLHILLIDDDEDEYFLLNELLFRQAKGRTFYSYALDWVSTYEEALRAISNCHYDVLLVDYRLGAESGLHLLEDATALGCKVPIIMLSGYGDYQTDLRAMELGAADYLEKEQLTLPLLERSIRYAVERARNLAELQKQAQEIETLQKATSSLLNTLDLSRLMGQILDVAQEAIPSAERSWLHIVEQAEARFDYLNAINFSDPRIHRVKLRGPYGDALQILSKGQPLLVKDMQEKPDLLAFLEKAQNGLSVRSAVIAPLLIVKDVFGTISLSASSPSAFTEGDLSLLTSFAATASVALHNAILYAETQNLATRDPLTGKLNRRTLFEFGQREVDRSHRFGHQLSALMFDVDYFKEVNDQFGHSTGDKVLVAIAERCSRVIRHVDILGRYGGDEFAVLLPEADIKIAKEIADRIRESISTPPIATDAGLVSVSISIGVAQADRDITKFTALLHKADQALYQSKQTGRNSTTPAI